MKLIILNTGLAICFFMFLTFILVTTSEGNKCLQDPLKFAVVNLEEANNANLSCSCTLLKERAPPLVLDHNGLRIAYDQIPVEEYDLPNLNWSEIAVKG